MKTYSIIFCVLLMSLSGSCVKGSASRIGSKQQYKTGHCGKAVLTDLELLERYCDIESSDKKCKAAASEFLTAYPNINCTVSITTTNEESGDVEVSVEQINTKWVNQLAESMGADDEDEDNVDDVEEEALTEI